MSTSKVITQADLASILKTGIKTVNNTSLLGSGNVSISTVDSTKVAKAGDVMSGGLAINAGSGYSSYNEGIRINAGSQNFATLLLGGTNGTTQGTNDGAYWLGVNTAQYGRRFMIAHNGSGATGTYFYADSSSQVTPSLQVGKDLKVLGTTTLLDTTTIPDANIGTLNVTGHASVAGDMNAKTYYGDGSHLTGISAGSSATTLSVTLSSSGWSSNSITVTATGVTASNTVIVSPAPASMSLWSNCGVYCSAQSTNTLTFTCSSVPGSNITVNVIILS